MKPRGYALYVLMTLIATLAIAVVLISAQLESATKRHRPDDARNQALWLARSAVTAGITGNQTVSTAAGTATVRVQREGAKLLAIAELSSGVAKISVTPRGRDYDSWEERYEAKH